MSDTVSNDVSTESLCTVIENCSDNNRRAANSNNNNNTNNNNNNNNSRSKLQNGHQPEDEPNNKEQHDAQNSLKAAQQQQQQQQRQQQRQQQLSDYNNESDNDSRRRESNESATEDEQTTTEVESNRDTTPEKSLRPIDGAVDGRSGRAPVKLKKSVSFDPNDENVRKFITGEPIVDQRNPFKAQANGGSLGKKKKVPPPVPAKRSTLVSVKKTVTQQLREREREREKERERAKNETNQRKSNGDAGTPTSPEEFVTTEDVLKQSKYVKTYIKNPDPVFVYDPTILARIKFEELREISDKKPPKKLRLTPLTKDRLRDLHKYRNAEASNNKNRHGVATFKKCSKPNYPELSDIKIKVGTETDGSYFNPAEVTKNAKKFDERVKKLHLGSDDDLDEIEEPLTKSESSDEVALNGGAGDHNNQGQTSDDQDTVDGGSHHAARADGDGDGNGAMNGLNGGTPRGTFTNTIKSKEFQEYLEKKGLTLIPTKIPSGAKSLYANGGPRPNGQHIAFKTPERVQISLDGSADEMAGDTRNGSGKKPSVFQRLLANSIFASRRRTTPKETVPTPRHLYANAPASVAPPKLKADKENAIKRVVLERQSFHGRPRASNLFNGDTELRTQPERTRKSFASDDLSVSISSALTNAEYALSAPDSKPLSGGAASGVPTRPLAKPPRRTLSRDRLATAQAQPQAKPPLPPQLATADGMPKARLQRTGAVQSLPREYRFNGDASGGRPDGQAPAQFQRSGERQSLIPKRSAPPNDRRQVFGRSASMDRNEILKRTAAARGLPPKPKSAAGTPNGPIATANGGAERAPAAARTMAAANLLNSGESQFFAAHNGPRLVTSTPTEVAARMFAPITASSPLKPAQRGDAYVDQQEWERLRAMKESTDRELYYKMLQQQPQQPQPQQPQPQQPQHGAENIYEHLPNAMSVRSPPSTSLAEGNFIRGSPQRNTHTGVVRSSNRQVKIIDGRPVVAIEQQQAAQQQQQQQAPRSQSVLDGMTRGQQQGRSSLRRGYDSDNETPVVYRRKQQQTVQADVEPRRIGGLLTREEILQKVKEFCRKSLNKTPTGPPPLPAVYEKQHAHASTDISPVSYASVETQQRSGSRIYAGGPQVPQRMHSLPRVQYVAATLVAQQQQQQLELAPSAASTASPIYAHVVKRGSLQSNQSELYETPARPYFVRRESDTQTVYIRQHGGALQPAELLLPPAELPQYILVDGDKLVDLYARPPQPQYVRPHQLQAAATAVLMPSGYAGYHTLIPTQHQLQLQQQQQQQQQLRSAARLHDGRSTPLILDRSSQQVSQIYWTPQHQRLQQQQQQLQQQQQQLQQQHHTGLIPLEISPRYALKQPLSYPVPAPRALHQLPNSGHRAAQLAANIPQQQQHLQQLRQQQNSPVIRVATPPNTHHIGGGGGKQQQLMRQTSQTNTNQIAQQQSAYEWESGSEAGEVQRIMERRNSGELKFTHALKNLRMKISRLVDGMKR